jgi:predicted transcriptional regulator
MKLKDYLIEERMGVVEFSRISGVSIPTIYDFIQGKPRKIQMKTVKKIEISTQNKVTLKDFVS